MDDSVRRNIARLVAGIVVADEDFDPTEDFFLDRVLERMGIGGRAELEPLPDASDAALEMARLGPDEREGAFRLLLEAATSDNQVVSAERVYLIAVGTALGLDADAVEQRLQDHYAERHRQGQRKHYPV